MKIIKRLWPYIRPYRLKMILSIALSIILSAVEALNPFIIGLIITSLGKYATDLLQGIPNAAVDYTYIFWVIVALAVTSVIRIFSQYFSNYILADFVQDTMYDIRRSVNAKLNRLAVSYFDKRQQGEVLSRVTNDIDTVGVALQQGLLSIFTSALQIFFTIVMMLLISPPMTLIILFILLGTFLITKVVTKRSLPHFQALQAILGKMNGFVQEKYTGFAVLKLFNKQQDSIEEFDKINDELYEVGFRSSFISGLMNPLVTSIVHIAYLSIMLIGAGYVFSGILAIGNLQAFMQYIWLINQPLGQVTQLAASFQGATASLERVVEVLDEPEEKPDPQEYPINLGTLEGNVAFNNVAFGYEKNLLMENVDFKVSSGQKIAIVGPTGAGKTTLINLLMRFYDVKSGSITVDGVDIRKMTRQQVRSIFGMVLQDPWLYHSTIADNIRFGRLAATNDEIIKAGKTANVDHFIRTLPDGYETMINKEGDNVSQGQKQLLTIARVLISNCKILILDEATSSVDTRLEVLIQKAMDKAMKSRTSFIIAHRLSTIRDADLILVMNQGAIVEQGTHYQLLEQGGMYKTLYESQFSEEEE